MQAFLRTLRVPSFGRLALTYALNEMADWFASIALAVLIYDATHDPLATTALFLGNRFLPAFAVQPLMARLHSRPTARTLACLYVIEALALGALALTTGAFWLPAVLVLATFDGTIAATGRALTRSATVALMEPHGLLREGNATLNLSFSVMNAAAPALAGVLVAVAGSGVVLVVTSVLFLAQAITIGGARSLPAGEAEAPPWKESLKETIAYVRGHHFLRPFLLSQSVVLALLYMVPPIEVVYAKESLGVGDTGFGILLAAWGGGMVVGSLVFARERKRSILALVTIGTVGAAVAYLGMAVAPNLALACVAAAVGGIANGMQWVAVVTAAQEATEDRFQGGIAGLMEGLLTAVPGLGFLLGGAVTAIADPRMTLAISGLGAIIVMAASVPFLRGHTARAPSVVEPQPEPVPA